MRWRVPLGFPAGLPDCPGSNGRRARTVAALLLHFQPWVLITVHVLMVEVRSSHREQEGDFSHWVGVVIPNWVLTY